jgi:two-component system, OmpR family, sensor histidine kinase MtrB
MRGLLAAIGPGKPLVPEARTRQIVARARYELDHLDQLVLGFVDASRIEWQRLDLQQGRRDLGKFLAGVVQVYETFSLAHRVSLTVPEHPVWVFFDHGRMSQVVNTLLSNAIQSSPKGGVIEVDLAGGSEDESVSDGEKEAVVTVTDHGAGVEREALGAIFQPFLTASVQKPRPGAVAMWVAKRVVEAHGGHIDVQSEPGKGATFRVRLPAAC